MNTIKRLFSRRAIALLAVVAIAGSGLTSMAALSSGLTVSSSFQAARAELKGNPGGGTPTAATVVLFDQMVMEPQQIAYKLLQVVNSGTVALHVVPSRGPVNGAENLMGNLKGQIYAQVDAAANPACDATSVANPAKWATINGSFEAFGSITGVPFDLNAGATKNICWVAKFDASGTSTGWLTYDWMLTGTSGV